MAIVHTHRPSDHSIGIVLEVADGGIKSPSAVMAKGKQVAASVSVQVHRRLTQDEVAQLCAAVREFALRAPYPRDAA